MIRTCTLAATGMLAVAILATSCSSNTSTLDANADGLVPVTFQLNWTAGGPNAGFAIAEAEGLYQDAGLDVTLVEGTGSGPAAQLVANNQAQLGFADATAVSQLVAKGAPVKVIAPVYQASPNNVLALADSDISSIADLKGHTVGMPQGSSQAAMLPLLLGANGLTDTDFDLVNIPPTSLVPALMEGRVDAVMGGVDSTTVQLKLRGANYDEYIWANNGVSTVAQSIFGRDTFLAENPDLVRRFVAASLQGWAIAREDPARAMDALERVFPDVARDSAEAELAGIAPLMCGGDAKFIGRAEPELWARTVDLLSKVDLLPDDQSPESLYTNDYLPDESQMHACS